MTRRALTMTPTTLGLACALVLPFLYLVIVDPYIVAAATGPNTRAVIGYVVMWTLVGAVVAVTALGERRQLSSIGLRRPSVRLLALAVGAGLTLSLLYPLVTVAADGLVAGDPSEGVGVPLETSVWVLAAGVVTAAVTEEVLFRGYAIERLIELTGRAWLSGLLSLVVFVAIHVPTKGLAHVLGVVVPLGAALTVLYLRKRNLTFVAVVHLMVDAPLIVLALAE